jgi:hypothetical protein
MGRKDEESSLSRVWDQRISVSGAGEEAAGGGVREPDARGIGGDASQAAAARRSGSFVAI